MMNRTSLFSVCLAFVAWGGAHWAEAAPGDEYWDERFGVPGVGGNVVTCFLASGGPVYAGGNFTSIGGVAIVDVAQWDGMVWRSLGSGFDPQKGGHVRALALLGTDLIVGGSFSEVGGIQASNIAKWNGQTWSALGEGVNGLVNALAVIGNDLYVGGNFTSAGSLSARRIAKWDGRTWSGLGSGVSKIVTITDPFSGGTYDMAIVYALLSEGTNLYVGGEFDRAGDVEANSIAKWDGEVWSALESGIRWNPTEPISGTVLALASDKSNLFVGGAFNFAGSVAATYIARWDGNAWHALGSGIDDHLGVQALTAHGGTLYAGGIFSRVGGVTAPGIARWDGLAWSPLGSGVSRASVTALSMNNGQLFVGGAFTYAGKKASASLALWHIPEALHFERSSDMIELSWPAPDTNLVLEARESFSGANWVPVAAQPALQRNRLTVTEKISGPQKFYRLRQR